MTLPAVPHQRMANATSWQPGQSGNPNGRRVEHGTRRRDAARRSGGKLDAASEAAVCAKVNEYAADAGGVQNLTNREVSILRDAAICDLIVAEAFAYARRKGSIFRRDGQLLPVLDRNLLAYVNSKRLALVALGLRPERADKVPSLAAYLAERSANSTTQPSATPPPDAEPSSAVADAPTPADAEEPT